MKDYCIDGLIEEDAIIYCKILSIFERIYINIFYNKECEKILEHITKKEMYFTTES